MSQLIFSTDLREAAKTLLAGLPQRRMRDVIEKRFGLKGGKPKTLQAIGGEYKITRERVRQIEADALKHLMLPVSSDTMIPLVKAFEEHLLMHRGVIGEARLLGDAGEAKLHPHVLLLLNIMPLFTRLPETESLSARWTMNQEHGRRLEEMLGRVLGRLEEDRRLVSEADLLSVASAAAQETYQENLPRTVIESHLAVSKRIRKNPYGEYGLIDWPEVSPSGVKDKAYVALAKAAKPMHFREVALAIDRAGWSRKKAHPQTVHNELIKDKRFVLVGRGLYALKEWGYEPGSVRDIMISVLKSARQPLTKDEIIASALEKRHVKVPTILLNLQNQSVFKRTGDGKYMLV